MKNNSLFTANAFTSYNKLCNVIIFLITLILVVKMYKNIEKKIQEKKYIYISIFLAINNNNIKILT